MLEKDTFKKVVTDSLGYLSENKLINVYGFVVMPNHIHLIGELLKMNGKEMPHASFMKFTAHEFKNLLLKINPADLSRYGVNELTRDYRFWQREPLAIEVFSRKVIEQKLDYIHGNPIQGKWNLCKQPDHYMYSSASFYESNLKHFTFLKHYMDRI